MRLAARGLIAAALALALPPAPAGARRAPQGRDLDVVHYRLELRLPREGKEIRGRATLLVALPDASARGVALDFSGMAVDSVSEGGRQARFSRSGDRLEVDLSRGYALGERAEISVEYHGEPSDGLFVLDNKFGARTVFADNWPNRAHKWFPSNDRPSDKATVEFLVTAPGDLEVVANGALVEKTPLKDGTTFTHWRTAAPIPTYCMVIGAAAFAVLQRGSWGCVPLTYFLYPRDRENGLRGHGRALEMLAFYSDLVGPFPYEKLALVQSTTRFGGMENASAIFFDEKAYTAEGRLEGTVAHEIAHQWFGDAVTEADWHDLWLSEGFATYFGHLFFERFDGRDRMRELLRADRRKVFEADAKGAAPVRDPRITNLSRLLNAYTYQKGAWVLHMLRGAVGDEAFFAAVREYYRTYRDGNATTDDLRRVMERHHGRPLDWFFRQWVLEAGHPVCAVTWRWDEAAKRVRVRVRQTQPWPPFRMTVAFAFAAGGRTETVEREIAERDEAFEVEFDARPDSVVVDPQERLLAEFSVSPEPD